MHYPLYIITGGAGSGKDTVAEMMVAGRRGVMIAQADPMKRFAMAGFGFSFDQLWGPSSSRNAPDERYAEWLGGSAAFEQARLKIFGTSDRSGQQFIPECLADKWLREIHAGFYAYDALMKWFNKLEEAYTQAGHGSDRPVLTPRACLQLLGTEFGRSQDQNLWSNYAIEKAEQLLLGDVGYSRELGLVSAKGMPGYNFVVITDGRFRNEVLNVKRLNGAAIQILNPAASNDSKAVEAAGVKGHISESELKGIPQSWFDTFIYNDKSLGLDMLRHRVNEVMNIVNLDAVSPAVS